PLAGASRRNAGWMAAGSSAAVVQLLLIAAAFAALTHAFVTSDFSVKLAADNSHSLKPLIYKISGVWGNHEGSMLLWVLILALFGALIALFGGNLPPTLRARVLSVQAMIGAGFLLFILATSNPFARLFPPPADGNDLNPLLQDPGLAFHPPVLYAGYVGFSIAFSFAVAALIEGRVDAAWARWVRPWTLLAWSFLTAGIALGSWWAYYELGWGGFWYWDPVENASFMPWLVGTALLHSAVVVEKRDALKSWTILLAILTFSLSLIGTFLVRSGVLTSVHAFATDPGRGVFILALLVIAIGGGLALYAWRAPQLKGGGLFAPLSREGALLLNNLILATAAATVFIGTLYPLVLEAAGGGKVSVGPPYYNATFVPLMAPLVAAMAVGPMLAWKRGDLSGALGRLKFAAAAALAALAAASALTWGRPVLGAIAMGAAAWIAVGVFAELAGRIRLGDLPLGQSLARARGMPRSAWGMTLAHLGLAGIIAGAAGAALWSDEKIIAMRPGQTVDLAGYSLSFEGAESRNGPNYTSVHGVFAVSRNRTPVTKLEPEKRRYVVGGQETTEAAIHTTAAGDLYAVIGDAQKDGGYVVRLYYKPLVAWIWAGAAVMVLGGLMSLSDRRLRIGAPARRERDLAPDAAPAE
ncbi:MAG: heme lyase CcmF/NrfE family subunit, partial [Alphaproteobacteria bacterium]